MTHVEKIIIDVYDPDLKTNKWGDVTSSKHKSYLKAVFKRSTLVKLFQKWNEGKEVAVREIADSWYTNYR